MSFLEINTLACTESELLHLGRTLPSKFAPFNLLSEQNLVRLHRLLLLNFSQAENKTPSQFSNIQFPFAINQQAEFSLPGMPLKPWHVQIGVFEKQKNQTFEDQSN